MPGGHAAEPVRVLHVAWSLTIGGAERALYQLVRGQREAGINTGVLVASDLGLYGTRLAAEGVPVQTLGQRRGSDLRACLRARSVFTGFDVVHFHVAEPLLMLAAALGPASLYYTHRAGAFRYEPRQRLRYRAAGMVIRPRFAGIAGNTAHAAGVAADLFSVPRAKIEVAYNGIDWDILRPERDRSDVLSELDVPSSAVLLGTSANLRELKRVDMVIRALAHTPGDVIFVVVGDGPERQSLETLARDSGMGRRVRFAGNRANVADFLQVFDVFVMPSGPEESFGNSAVEAMGSGVPTIVLEDGGGLVEHVVHGETGVVAKNEADLAVWITRLARNEELRREIGACGRDSVRQKYTVERMVRENTKLYAGRTDGCQ